MTGAPATYALQPFMSRQSSLTACVYPAEMTAWARAKPPLTLK